MSAAALWSGPCPAPTLDALDRPVTAYFEAQVHQAPGRLAVYSDADGRSLSYAELDRRANRLAHRLIAAGVPADGFVGVCMQRSVELVVALLAVVKAGAAYVPLDPDYPPERLEHMLVDSGVRWVLGHAAVPLAAHPALPAGVDVIELDEAGPDPVDGQDETAPAFRGGPDTAVYMIYTSGSTGRPKGVPNLHRGLANRLLWMQQTFALGPDDRVLQKTPFSFDVSVWEFFWPLMVGASIHLARPGGHRDSGYLVDLIARAGISTLHFVPSMLSLFLAAPGLDRLGSLKRVICSGEALPYELTRRFFERLPGVELHNLYGPTEAAIDVTWWPCRPDGESKTVPIGHPIANTQALILDAQLRPLPPGEAGELHLGGVQLARGYWNRPELTRERFIPDPFSPTPGARLYKTGDLARQLPSGAIEYLGRLDFQVKLRGLRIELGEIESVLLQQAGIREAVVVATEAGLEEKQLLAYLVAEGEPPALATLKQGLTRALPEHMVPARFMFLDALPLSPNGKVDRAALPAMQHQRPELAEMYIAPRTPLQRTLCTIWQQVLDLDRVGIRDNFFDLGGHSLQLLKAAAATAEQLGRELPAVQLFQFPSVERLAAYLEGEAADPLRDEAFRRAFRSRGEAGTARPSGAVAVIGMVGRFPGARDLRQLWRNLLDDVESITRFTPEELAQGVDEETRNDPNYVPCRGILDDADKFDNTFFGIGPQEAKVMDPQQRVFLELAWHALEDAGHDPARFAGMIGVYAGVGDNHYYVNNVLSHPDLVKTVGKLIVGYGNEKDYIATRVSYQLDLTGPSVSATTGCSTSLLSVDNACKALNAFECDMALAGGVDILVPQKSGQIHQAGGPFTRDGHCRPFDAEASGTMFSDGAGIVVLRRLEDAIADGDHIYAVVLGSAKNNDGARKVSFLAPSVEGQARVIALAQAQANVQADSIGYVEAHGTGTPLGDPIELEALTQAFRASTAREQFCRIGSIKGHIGHPTIASGIAGFIKVALALQTEEIPGTLHYRTPNPRFDFERSPFEVVARRTPWPRGLAPRRGAVSSFGFGGTNVHAILEEAPAPASTAGGPSRSQLLLPLSAKTPAALERLRQQLAVWLGEHPEASLADVAHTLQIGRRALACRDAVVAPDLAAAIRQLATPRPASAVLDTLDAPVVFMFPGQGAQYANMGRDLYREEPEFRHWMDRCCALFRPHLDRDLHALLLPPEGQEDEADEALKDTGYTQPAMFTLELSLARWWMSLGVKPAAVLGHSVGEFVGAQLAGIFTLEQAVALVALRARLIRALPAGAMLSVRCAPGSLAPLLPAEVQLAAANGPELCVLAGPTDAVAALAGELEARGIGARLLQTSHAFHSAMMDDAVAPFLEALQGLPIGEPTIPFMSTSLGDWARRAQDLGPAYWAQHIRRPVLFEQAVGRLLADSEAATVFLEVGPRDTLATLTRLQAQGTRRQKIVASLGDAAGAPDRDLAAATSALGRLWTQGVPVDWTAYRGRQPRRRVPLPTYPFERRSHWLEPAQSVLRSPPAADRPPAATAATVAAVPAPPRPDALPTRLPPAAAQGAAVAGLQLGHDAQGRPCWYAPGPLGRPAPIGGHEASASPLAAPPQKRLEAPAGLQRIHRISRRDPAAALAFHEGFAIRLAGALDEAAFARAIQGLAEVHEALRVHFADEGRQLVIESTCPIPVRRQELGEIGAAGLEAALAQAAEADARTAYDLDAGPLCRVTWLRAGAQHHGIVLAAHAAVVDGWSLDNLLEDLGRLYASLSAQSAPSTLPRHGLGDYLAWRASPARQAKAQEARIWWHRQLSPPAAAARQPYDRPRPATPGALAQSAAQTLDSPAQAALLAFARRQGVSFFSVLFAGLVRQLAHRSGATDLIVGAAFADHPTAGMSDAVGRLVRVLPLRLRLGSDEPFAELCRRCHAAILEASEHTALDLDELAHEAGAARPAMAAVFTHVREYRPGELSFGAAGLSYRSIPRLAIETELDLTLTEAGDSLRLEARGLADLASLPWLAAWTQELSTQLMDDCRAEDDAQACKRIGDAAPADALERELAAIWSRTLGIDEVRTDTSFYELGGHSLLALQVFNEIHQKYRLRLPLSALVEHGTLRALATHLRSMLDLPADTAAPPAKGTTSAPAPKAAEAPAWNTVVPLQPQGDLPPLF
ncbi:MAG: amino acid adenylation domain-containing protein, partial [Curvibacter sp.]|nr:amino acid adenylation domain-containing protein [Curvibacter sp.]